MFSHKESVFPLCARLLITGYHFPAILVIGINEHLPCSHIYHRLNSKHHARYNKHARAAVAKMQDLRLLMELKSHSVTTKITHDTIMIFLGMLLYRMSDIAYKAIWLSGLCSNLKTFLGNTD